MSRKGGSVSFFLPGHYLSKLESRAEEEGFASRDLCAKQFTLSGIENEAVREAEYRMSELDRKLTLLAKGLLAQDHKLGQTLLMLLYEVGKMDYGEAAQVANRVVPGCVRTP